MMYITPIAPLGRIGVQYNGGAMSVKPWAARDGAVYGRDRALPPAWDGEAIQDA
jgi:hypothetical protein